MVGELAKYYFFMYCVYFQSEDDQRAVQRKRFEQKTYLQFVPCPGKLRVSTTKRTRKVDAKRRCLNSAFWICSCLLPERSSVSGPLLACSVVLHTSTTFFVQVEGAGFGLGGSPTKCPAGVWLRCDRGWVEQIFCLRSCAFPVPNTHGKKD